MDTNTKPAGEGGLRGDGSAGRLNNREDKAQTPKKQPETAIAAALEPAWVYDDGGRAAAGFKGKNVGDCVCRAVAIATGKPYRAIHNDLVEIGWDGPERHICERRRRSGHPPFLGSRARIYPVLGLGLAPNDEDRERMQSASAAR
jgi:hypothetical protein